MTPVAKRLPAGFFGMLLAVGCATGEEFSGPLPSPDGQQFVQAVYPLLLRDCAYVGCHGAKERFFQVYGPGRVRMPSSEMSGAGRVELDYADPATLDEIRHAYDRARSMLASSARVEESLLLQKPLEPEAGGQGHKGVDDLGRNVFASKRDDGWRLLLDWAKSQGQPPSAAQVRAWTAAVSSSEAQP